MTERILTTCSRSLPRPDDLLQLLFDRDEGHEHDAELLDSRLSEAVADVVAQQRQAGLDVVVDGEQSRISHATYLRARCTGFGGEGPDWDPADVEDHPDWRLTPRPFAPHVRRPVCVGPITYVGHDEVRRDIANLVAVAPASSTTGTVPGRFLSVPSPGVIALFMEDAHYRDLEAYLAAMADALSVEYRTIVDAGLGVELDCTDLVGARHMRFADRTIEEFRAIAALCVEALGHAVAGLPAERLRIHLSWGSYPGPHDQDVPLRDVIDIVLQAPVAGICFEASNVRHAHEHEAFDDVRLPEGRYLVPGVVDPTINRVEHPELIAQRLAEYGRRVGPDAVMAGTDGGFATWSGSSWVAPSIAWAKLHAMVEGARLAAERLAMASPA